MKFESWFLNKTLQKCDYVLFAIDYVIPTLNDV